jgi:hypothetical protein
MKRLFSTFSGWVLTMKARRLFQQLKSVVIASVLADLAVPGMAPPVKTWSHQELFQSADAVLVLAVLDIERAQEKPAAFGIADTYQAYRARCRVPGVLKGDAPPQEVSLLFFQHADGRLGFNGVIPAPLSRDQRLEFLAYLRREKSGGWVPVTGHEDAGLSIKALMKNLDHKYLDLPPATPENRAGTNGPSAATAKPAIPAGPTRAANEKPAAK